MPSDYYWANEPPEQAKALVERLNQKTDRFLRLFRSSHHANRIIRNYRYYYGLFFDAVSDNLEAELRRLGERGQYVGLAINHFRSLIQHLVILTTQGEVAYDTRAVNTDPESLQQARIGNNVLDTCKETKDLDGYIRAAVEHAAILTAGYVMTYWDWESGAPKTADENGTPTSFEGDVAYRNPLLLDVVYDPRAKKWPDDVKWVRVRQQANIWDIATLHPEQAEDILRWRGNRPYEDTRLSAQDRDSEEDSDWIDVWEFFHLPTPAIPQGRYLKSVGDVALLDMPMPYPWLPIDRVVAGEQIGTTFGYTPAFDLQSIQEAYNAEASAIASNHKSYGIQSVYVPTGTNIRARELQGGLNVVFADQQPIPLSLLDTSPELMNFLKHLGMEAEMISGVNSVARGQPEANLKSGTALALVDAKAMQAASILVANTVQLQEGVGTKTLKLYNLYGGESPRALAIAGRANRPYMDSFSAKDLDRVERVIVKTGNPLMKSITGRMEIAEKVKPWVRTGEEYLGFLSTGNLDTMTEADQNMLSHLREEQAMLLDGKTVVASAIDNHVLHIREHHGILSSWKIRQDPQISANVLGHIQEHMVHLKSLGVQELLMVLGFPVPPVQPLPPEALGAMQGGGGPPPMNPQGNPEARPEANAAAPRQPRLPQPPAAPVPQ